MAEDLRLALLLEPEVVDRRDAGGGVEDHVEEIVALAHLGDPALVLDLGLVAALLEEVQDARIVAGLAEDVDVLGRAPHARIGVQRIGARDQERQAALGEHVQTFGIEILGLRTGSDGRSRPIDETDIVGLDRHG